MKMPTPISLMIVGLMIAIFCGILTFFIYRQQVITSKWPTVPGVITVSSKTLVFVEDSKNTRIGMAWRPLVNYSFKVNNVEYIGTEISRRVYQDKTISAPPSSGSYTDVPPTEGFLKILNRYAVGNPVTVHYNPNDPKDSLLEIDKTTTIISGSITIAGILLSLVSLLYYFFWKRP